MSSLAVPHARYSIWAKLRAMELKLRSHCCRSLKAINTGARMMPPHRHRYQEL